MSILQMKKPRHREIQESSQGQSHSDTTTHRNSSQILIGMKIKCEPRRKSRVLLCGSKFTPSQGDLEQGFSVTRATGVWPSGRGTGELGKQSGRADQLQQSQG